MVSDTRPEPFRDQATLLDALRDGAELEHQLMVQYLYAGFSLVREPYGKPGDERHCTPAQYEAVRRWSSTLFMVARQEMEHLSLANGMLAALDGEPHLARENITQRRLLSPYFTSAAIAVGEPVDPGRRPRPFPYAFTRFDESTMRRFVCGESPPAKDLPKDLPKDRDASWCFFNPLPKSELAAVVADEEDTPLGRTHIAAPVMGTVSGQKQVQAGGVQELYERIKETFRSLPELEFASAPAEVEIPVEYQVFVFPVTDRTTAMAAIDLILEQGEGLVDPWNLDSHFRRFLEINQELKEMRERDDGFDPAYELLDYPDPTKIDNLLTRFVFDAANEAYVTLLFILASLYQNAVPAAKEEYPYLSTALSQNAFAPAMTMIVRALTEVLVRLPVAGAGSKRIGPNYWIPAEDLALLEHPDPSWTRDLSSLMRRWDRMVAAIKKAADQASVLRDAADEQADVDRPREEYENAAALRYVYESAYRTGLNIEQTYEQGLYSKFVKIPGAKA